jgi:hypothetical protein
VEKVNDELFKQFLKELDEAPDYVKENTMCYFWHNTSACTKCPKKDCKAREPRRIELPPKIQQDGIPPVVKAGYMVRLNEWTHFHIPNPETNYNLFCHVIRQLGTGEYIKLFNRKDETPPILNEKEREEFIKGLKTNDKKK